MLNRVWKIFEAYSLMLDWLGAHRSLRGDIPTKYQDLGATSTVNTNYKVLRQIFKDKKHILSNCRVFCDVGCGKGRVINYLILNKFLGKIIGVELDKDVASHTREWCRRYKNVTIINNNILNISCLDQIDVFYLYNPFNKQVLVSFVNQLELAANHNVRVIYCNALYPEVFEGKNWTIVDRFHVTTNYIDSPNICHDVMIAELNY